MIKKLLSITFLFVAFSTINAQSFNLVYEFSGVTGTSGTVDPTPTPTAVGVTSGSFTANNLSSNPTTTNVFAFTSWTTGTVPELTKFFELSLTPQSNYFIDLSHMSFYTTRSNSGPQNWCVRTSLDSYAANAVGTTSLISPTSSGSIITVNGNNEFVWGTPPTHTATTSSAWRNNCQVNFTGASNIASQVKIRYYAYNAPANGGSWRVDSVVVYGSATFSVGAGLNNISHDVNAQFKLFPNPTTNGIVFLEPKNADKGSLEIVNMLGAIVAKEEKESGNSLVKIDVSTLPVGTYFVKYTYANKMHSEKLIISK